MKIENVDSLQLYPLLPNCDHEIIDADRCRCTTPLTTEKNNSRVNYFSVREASNLFSIDEKLLIEKITTLKEDHYSGRKALWDFQIGVYNIRVNSKKRTKINLEKLKPSSTILPKLLEARNKNGKYDELIRQAKAYWFDDYKFDLVIPKKLNWVGPKVALANILYFDYPELADIRQMVINGDFDDQCDEDDKNRIRSELPSHLHKHFGL